MTTRNQYHGKVNGTSRHDGRFDIAIIGRDHNKPDDSRDVCLQLWAPWLSASFELSPDKARELARHLLDCADANEPIPVSVPMGPATGQLPAMYREPEAEAA